MDRTLVLESAHQLHRRPQFKGAVGAVLDGARVTRAACGCENTTRVVQPGPLAGHLYGDGATYLCPDHAIPDEDD